ncbi:type II secretion system protein [Massilia sp. TS11]|uniref:type II secretion system protein n=1 Tax=Massilia sp. TS11 TaxID=2908003 RepID=UPI001EDBBA83|nr:type II secretion system protein [Massilia sp. TS11]MCG2584549.1 type II secretion system GspH family protein [Massilia sp. TS11]
MLRKHYKHCQYRQRGFSLFELAMVVIVVALLGGALLNRVEYYQEQAELTARDQILANVQAALTLKLASVLVKGQDKQLESLERDNPVELLAKKPSNYVGEYFAPKLEDIEPGSWYFDKKDHKLVYFPNHTRNLRNPYENLIKFKVKLLRAQDQNAGIIEGVVIEQVPVPRKS